MLYFVLYVRILTYVCTVFYHDVETSRVLPFVIELDVVIVFIIGAISQQHLNNFYEKLSDAVN